MSHVEEKNIHIIRVYTTINAYCIASADRCAMNTDRQWRDDGRDDEATAP